MNAAAKPRNCAQDSAQGEAPSAAPIDLTHLRRFTLGDKELEQEILGLFIQQAPLTIESLKRARTNRDWTIAAHTLKGSARAVGAWRLAKIAERAEGLGGRSDRSARDLVLRHLEEAAAEAHAHIASLESPC